MCHNKNKPLNEGLISGGNSAFHLNLFFATPSSCSQQNGLDMSFLVKETVSKIPGKLKKILKLYEIKKLI